VGGHARLAVPDREGSPAAYRVVTTRAGSGGPARWLMGRYHALDHLSADERFQEVAGLASDHQLLARERWPGLARERGQDEAVEQGRHRAASKVGTWDTGRAMSGVLEDFIRWPFIAEPAHAQTAPL